MAEGIAYCGLDCSGCEAYLATLARDDDKRAEVAKAWSARYNADIRPEQINCDGCRAEGRKFFYCAWMCELRKCGVQRGVENCDRTERIGRFHVGIRGKTAPLAEQRHPTEEPR